MDLVIRISREDLLAALKASETAPAVTAEVVSTPSFVEKVKGKLKKQKPAKEEPKAVELEDDEDDDEDDVPEVKPAKKSKKKAEAKPAPLAVVPDEDEDDEDDDEDDSDDEDEEDEDDADEEFVVGEDLKKLKSALNAHKAANGGKAKKTLDILRKFAPGGSEKVKPDVLPKLLKALKVG